MRYADGIKRSPFGHDHFNPCLHGLCPKSIPCVSVAFLRQRYDSHRAPIQCECNKLCQIRVSYIKCSGRSERIWILDGPMQKVGKRQMNFKTQVWVSTADGKRQQRGRQDVCIIPEGQIGKREVSRPRIVCKQSHDAVRGATCIVQDESRDVFACTDAFGKNLKVACSFQCSK